MKPFAAVAALLPLDWSSADPKEGLAQIEQAQSLIHALHMERILEWLSKDWPASLDAITVKRSNQGFGWTVHPAMSAQFDDCQLVASNLSVDLAEANLPSEWVMSVFYGRRGTIGPSFLDLKTIQEQARQTIAERVGPLRAQLRLEENLPEASPSAPKAPRF